MNNMDDQKKRKEKRQPFLPPLLPRRPTRIS